MTGYPIDRALSEIKNAVDSITTFPEETEKPIVSHVDDPEHRGRDRRLRRHLRALAQDLRRAHPRLDLLARGRHPGRAAERPRLRNLDRGRGRDAPTARPDFRRGRRRRPPRIPRSPGRIDQDHRRRDPPPDQGPGLRRERVRGIVLRTEADGTRLLLSDAASTSTASSPRTSMRPSLGNPAVTIKAFRVGDQKVIRVVDAVRSPSEGVRRLSAEWSAMTIWGATSPSRCAKGPAQHPDQERPLRVRARVRRARSLPRLKLAFWVSIGVPSRSSERSSSSPMPTSRST